MDHSKTTVALGFTEECFPAGVHICQIFCEEAEASDAVLQFVRSGLVAGERAACFSERMRPERMQGYLAAHELSYDEQCSRGALTLSKADDVYFKHGVFDPEPMLQALASFHQEAVRRGFQGARVIGEMSPAIQNVTGGTRLLEYESKVSLMQRTRPVTCVCQYDARAFAGGMLMDVLKVHPLMVVRGAVVRNPFFLPPDDYLRP